MRMAGWPGLLVAGVCAVLAPAGADAQMQAAPAYASIAIVQPANDATVFDNAGDVAVTVDVSPALRARAGDRLALILDGKKAALADAPAYTLTKVARGEHTLEARVVDGAGKLVIASTPVKFQLWQASRLFPNRREK